MVSRDEYFKRVSGFGCSIGEIGLFRGGISEYGRFTATAPYTMDDYKLVNIEETRDEETERIKKELHRERQKRYKESLYNKPLRHEVVEEIGLELIRELRKYYYLGGYSTRFLSRVYGVNRESVREAVLNKFARLV